MASSALRVGFYVPAARRWHFGWQPHASVRATLLRHPRSGEGGSRWKEVRAPPDQGRARDHQSRT
jgi:hypothetical protein